MEQHVDSFPPEILEHIFTFLDDHDKISARLVSLLWFKLVRISTFEFAKVGPDIFPWLVTRLSKYNYPLGIEMHFLYYSISTKQFIDELSKLTQLRAIHVADQRDILIQDVKEDYWLKLSTLSNIESWNINEPWPRELLNKFPRLKNIHVPNPIQAPDSSLQLEELEMDIEGEVDLIRQLPSSLNSLTLIFKANAEDHDLNHLTNLTHLRIVNRNMDFGGVDTSNITSLLSLHLSLVNMSQIHKNTNLTQLYFSMNPYEFQNTVDILEEIRPLTSLESLSIRKFSMTCNASSNPFSVHSRLTYLSLDISGDLSLLCDSIRRLNLRIDGNFDHDSLTHLTNLEVLELNESSNNTRYQNYGKFLNSFTTLKHLSVQFLHEYAGNVKLESISKLTDLEQLTLEKASLYPADYIYLTNLQALSIKNTDLTKESWNNLTALKKLTYFSFNSYGHRNATQKSIDYNVLSQLPLRTLIAVPAIKTVELNLFSSVSKMTSLRLLSISRLKEDDDILMLAHLQHLRYLSVTHDINFNMVRLKKRIQELSENKKK